MSILFHIGYPKTGTRWFQERLFPLIKNYKIVSKSDIYKHIIEPDAYTFPNQDIKNLRKFFGQENLIFSLHELVGTNYQSDIHGLLSKDNAHRIKHLYPDSKIIIFIRNQLDIIESAYGQYIRQGGTYKISKYIKHSRLDKLSKFPLFDLSFYKYHRIIEHYIHHFGGENVYVYLYEDFIDNPEKFVNGFGKRFEIDLDYTKINYEIINPSYRKRIIYLLRFLNHFTEAGILNKHYYFHIPGVYRISRKILSQLNRYRIFGDKYKFGHELDAEAVRTLSEYYQPSFLH